MAVNIELSRIQAFLDSKIKNPVYGYVYVDVYILPYILHLN